MSDKDKADQLAREETDVSFSVVYRQLYPFECLCSVGEKMAKWKQQQMIEKAVDWLKENEARYWSSEYDTPQRLLDDFKEAMEE